MTESSLYERLGGAFAIAAVVDHFSEALVQNPIVGQRSENPALREWHTNNLGRLAGLKFMRTLWVCNVAGGPQQYAATKPGSTPLGLEEAHRELKIAPAEFDEAGIWTSQATLAPVFGDRVLPTTHLFALRPGVDPAATAKKLESAFLAHGMQADSLKKLLDEAVSANLTFDRLIEGFMGLGLIVGVAALGVITARAVVERRQQIGVLRAIGFRKRMVQLSFLLESSFIALTSIFVGTGLGLAVAFNVINDSRRTPSWENMSFVVPWGTLGIIFLAVYLVALLTTFIPALRASRIYPAEALRYQ